MSNVNEGQTVSLHYIGTFDDGTKFDSSRDRGQPLTFQVGSGQVIPGFDTAVRSMTVGDTQDVRIEAAEAYGEFNPEAFQDVPRAIFDPEMELVVDATVYGQQPDGSQMMARIVEFNDETVKLDLNHPLAGKPLNFNIELLTVE